MIKKQIQKKCDKLADLFLCCATEWKALSRSIERTSDKKELINIKYMINKRVEVLEPIFKNLKGGLKK